MKKRWKQTWGAVGLAGLMMASGCALLSGCDGTEAEDSKQVKLTLWTNARHSSAYMDDVIARFETKYPNIDIEMSVNSENYNQNLELSFSSNQAPDLFNTTSSARDLVDKNMIVPLNDYITPEVEALFGSGLDKNEDFSYDGKITAIGAIGSSIRLVYNKDLFAKAGLDAPPQTIEQLVDYAKKITDIGKAEGKYGFALNLKSPSSGLSRSLEAVASRSGVRPYDFTTGKYDFSGYRPIVEAFAQMWKDGSMFPGAEGLDIDPLRAQFAAGNIGMYMSLNYEVGVLNDQFPAQCEWDAAPVPYAGEPKGKSPIGVTKNYAISSQCKNPDAAWKFIEFYNSEENILKYVNEGYGNSINPKLTDKVDVSGIKNASSFLIDEKVDGVNRKAPHELGMKLYGKDYYTSFADVIYGETTFEAMLPELNKRYNDDLDQAAANGSAERIQD